MTCANCGNATEATGSFCGRCGWALPAGTAVLPEVEPTISSSSPVNGLAPWRGMEVAAGIAIIVIAIAPVILLAGEAGDLAGGHATAARVWASSLLMGFVMLGVVWQLGLKGFSAKLRGEPQRDPKRDLKGNLALLGLNLPTISILRSFLLTVGALGASLAVTGLYSALMQWLNVDLLVPPEIPADFAFPGAASALTFQALVVWTPVTEEIFFRGFIFAGLASRLGVRGAMIGSAVVFSVFHLDPGVLIPIFITGLLLAWLYRRTGSLWPSIAAHAGQNALALLASIFVV